MSSLVRQRLDQIGLPDYSGAFGRADEMHICRKGRQTHATGDENCVRTTHDNGRGGGSIAASC